MLRLSQAEFEESVARALDELPDFFLEKMSNIEVLVRPWPTRRDLREAGVPAGHTLLGLYHGIPLTERTSNYALVAPDTITLFQGPIEQSAGTTERIPDVVRRTVVHEVAHHFGISDDRLRELGAY
jgi:predicted Zn-dependent protease with MMP-like domain